MNLKMESMRSCMEVTLYLDDSPQHAVPIRLGTSALDVQKSLDDHRLWRKRVAHMLNSLVFEIAIKVIWELDNNRDCRFTHDVRTLYWELADRSQRELKQLYDEKSAILAALAGTDKKGRSVRVGDLTQFQSLQEALIANEDTMKNFKYDGVFNGKSSAMGSVMWNEEMDRIWVLPPLEHMRFPEALYNYTVNRVQKANRGANS